MAPRGYLSEQAEPARARPTITIENVKCLRATGRAILVRRKHEDGSHGGTRWVPQAVVHDDSEVYQEGDEGKLVIFEWWATQEGIEP